MCVTSFIILVSNAFLSFNFVYFKYLRLVGECISFTQHSGTANLLLLLYNVVGGRSLRRESLENLNGYVLVMV